MQLDPIIDWLMDAGLEGWEEPELISEFCRRLNRAGFALAQAVFFLDTLHPVLESQGYYWNLDEGGETVLRDFRRPDTEENARQWRSSPFFHMQERGLSELHLPLDRTDCARFAVLDEVRKAGHTDYFVMIHPVGTEDAIGEMDALFSRWSTKRAGGFTVPELHALRRLVPALALCVKTAMLRRTTGSLVEVYLGRDAGRRVLAGKIERGKTDSIHTVIWFSDMRNYTRLSEIVGSDDLVTMLNDYSEVVVKSVHAHGGDVLKFIGDGVLAIFNHSDAAAAAHAALSAWRDLRQRLRQLNRRRELEGKLTTDIHVGLHVGKVFYGNIGSDERLDFTVIGPAVNEASRIVTVCRSLEQELLVSSDLRALLADDDARDLVDFGTHKLKGVQHDIRLYGLES